jgi:hypothetical protein
MTPLRHQAASDADRRTLKRFKTADEFRDIYVLEAGGLERVFTGLAERGEFLPPLANLVAVILLIHDRYSLTESTV